MTILTGKINHIVVVVVNGFWVINSDEIILKGKMCW